VPPFRLSSSTIFGFRTESYCLSNCCSILLNFGAKHSLDSHISIIIITSKNYKRIIELFLSFAVVKVTSAEIINRQCRLKTNIF